MMGMGRNRLSGRVVKLVSLNRLWYNGLTMSAGFECTWTRIEGRWRKNNVIWEGDPGG